MEALVQTGELIDDGVRGQERARIGDGVAADLAEVAEDDPELWPAEIVFFAVV